MKPGSPRRLTIKGVSSSIEFAMFEVRDSLPRIMERGISAAASRVADRFIRTDEESMIAKTVCCVLGLG